MKLSIKLKLVTFIFVATSGGIAMASSVAALSNISPNPDDMFALNGNTRIRGGVSHILKKEDVALVEHLRVGVYSPNSTNRTLKIKYGIDGKKCFQDVDKNKGSIIVTVGGAGGASELTYTVPAKNMCSSRKESNNSKSSSSGNRFFANYKIPKSAFTYRADLDYYFAPVHIRFSNAVPIGNSQGNNVNFILETPGSNVKIGPLKTAGNTNFGLRSAYADTDRPARGVMVRVAFGAPCSENDPPGLLKLYDADTNVFGPTYLWATKSNTELSKGAYTKYDDSFIAWNSANKYWRSTAQEGQQSTRNSYFQIDKIQSGKTYRFIIQNPRNTNFISPNANVLSVGIPYDSIYADIECSYTLTPWINPPGKSYSAVTLGSSIPVQGHILSQGFDGDNHAWELTARVYGSKPGTGSQVTNTKLACAWKAGKSESCERLRSGTKSFGSGIFTRPNSPLSYSTDGLEAGDWVCFMMSVQKPTDEAASTRWRHSAMKCVRIAGNSSGVTTTDPTYSYYPDLGVNAVIGNESGNYPKKDSFQGNTYPRDEYGWKIFEVKFRSQPSGGVGTSEKGGCGAITDEYSSIMLSDSCENTGAGDDNLFPNDNAQQERTASSKQTGPDPIGTYTCYTLRFRTNPAPSNALEAAVSAYVTEQNNPPHRYWIPAVRDEDGKVITPGHYNRPAIKKSDLMEPYKTPSSSPAKYKFTPFRPESCSVSGIDPKVQIRSGDLKIGGGISTSLRTISVGEFDGKSFGSSAEYGVLSGDINARMASGSGLLAGSSSPNQDSWSSLTFANSAEPFGRFTTMESNSPEQDGATVEHLGDYSQGSREYTSGGTVIYRVTGTLTITGDLKYKDNDSYSKTSKIPRVIFIANRINIAPGVKRIDPWLVASEYVNTCSTVNPDDGAVSLTIDDCDDPLEFNGPVYTNEIFLYRTGGSRVPKSKIKAAWREDGAINPDTSRSHSQYCEDSSCGNAEYALSAPAESFNLRPDIYLTSYAGVVTSKPVATTDMVTELPPRF